MASDHEPGVDGFDALVGIEYLDSGLAQARARVAVGPQLRQPFGIVHGGVYAALAESLCSAATFAAVADRGMVALGQSNHTTFLRPISAGSIHATASARHSGRTSWVWDVELRDDAERLCALARVTVAVRPRPGAGASQPE